MAADRAVLVPDNLPRLSRHLFFITSAALTSGVFFTKALARTHARMMYTCLSSSRAGDSLRDTLLTHRFDGPKEFGQKSDTVSN